MAMKVQAYHARRPKSSPLWQCLDAHFDTFLDIYPEAYEHDYGFLRPVIPEVVGKFMGCGDFANGFARVRCDHCVHEYLLAFSCKGRCHSQTTTTIRCSRKGCNGAAGMIPYP